MKKVIAAAVGLTMLAAAPATMAVSYTGLLTYSGGGITTDPLPSNWANDSASLSWTVTDSAAGLAAGWWRYQYVWTANKPPGTQGGDGLSHIIIELSPGVTDVDIEYINPGGGEIKTYDPGDPGNSNPGLPGAIYGVKLDGGGSTAVTLVFDSNRAPVWGDFYAKDGSHPSVGDIYAYNTGFLAADPAAGPSDGTIDWHILRPDTKKVPDAGSTAALLGLAAIGLSGLRRKLS